MKIAVLASGSEGNAALFTSKGSGVLVDAGIGPRVLADRLAELGLPLPQAVLVTHAHQDHLGQCLRLSRKLKIPIYASEATARIEQLHGRDNVRVFSAREPFTIGALTLSPLPLPHDAAQVALTISDGARRAAIATDLGEVPPALPGHLAGCDVVLLESNHDVEMLRRGPYPAFLKRRVGSARGHLSNDQAHALLRKLPETTHTVVLLHLSRTNNRPELALEVARDALGGRRVKLLAARSADELVIDAEPSAEKRPRIPLKKPEQLSLF